NVRASRQAPDVQPAPEAHRMARMADRDLRACVLRADAGHDCRPLLRRDPVCYRDYCFPPDPSVGMGTTGTIATVLGREAILRNHASLASGLMPHSRIS